MNIDYLKAIADIGFKLRETEKEVMRALGRALPSSKEKTDPLACATEVSLLLSDLQLRIDGFHAVLDKRLKEPTKAQGITLHPGKTSAELSDNAS